MREVADIVIDFRASEVELAGDLVYAQFDIAQLDRMQYIFLDCLTERVTCDRNDTIRRPAPG